ncbi:MAG TPA: hypothetical protein VF223_12005 [Trebonia sp.]
MPAFAGQILQIARDAGFRDARHVPGAELRERYFTGRTDELRPSSGEDLLIATTSAYTCYATSRQPSTGNPLGPLA